MVSYPVRVPRDYYRGRDARRTRKADEFNRVATRVEAYINGQVAIWDDDAFGAFFSAMIAIELREDPKLVHDAVYALDCGSNGVTVCKGDYERAWAKRTSPPEEASA
jgi:hypothetical protein